MRKDDKKCRKERELVRQSAELISRNNDIQKTINAILRFSIEDLPLDKILEKSLELLLSIPWLSFESTGSIFIRDEELGRYFTMAAQKGIPLALQKRCYRIKEGVCICGLSAKKKQMVFSNKIDKHHTFTHKRMKPHGHYCLPIMSKKEVLGILNIYLKEKHTRKKYEEDFLLAIADTLAGVIQRKKSEELLAKISRARLVLSQSNHALIYADDEFQLLNDVCKIIVNLGKYNLAWMGEPINDRKKSIKILAKAGISTDYLKKIKLSWSKDVPWGNGPAGKCVRTKSIQIAKDIRKDATFLPWMEFIKEKGFKSTAALPLESNGNYYGLLAIYANEPDSFDEEEMRLLTELSNDLAFGIYTLRLKKEKEFSENNLKATNRLLQSAFSNTHFLMAYLDKDFNFKKVNTAYAQVNGLPESYFVGKNLFDEFTEDKEVKDVFKKVLSTGKRYIAYEKPYLEEDGRTTFWDWTIEPIKGLDGRVEEFLFTLIDVTDRVQSEQKLIESYKHMGSINRQIAILLEMGNQTENSKESELMGHIINSAQSLSGAKFVGIYKYHKKGRIFSCLNANPKNHKMCNLETAKSPINTYDLVHKKIRTQGIMSAKEKRENGINFTYYILKPIETTKGLWGALMLGFSSTKNIITSQELDFYQVFVAQAGIALEKIKCDGKVCYLNPQKKTGLPNT